MAGKPDAKLKLLYLKDILEKNTDEEHILNANELADLLFSEHGIECERKSIYKDIDILQDYGLDIVRTLSPKKGFFAASGRFELAEIRLMSDAVKAADFITKSKTEALLKKFESFISVYRAAALRKQVYVDKGKKSGNESVFYNIDALDTAIKSEKKVTLVYSRRRLDDKFAARKERRTFTLSPYGLIWSNDRYYLIANNEKYDNLMNLRIDRISNVEIKDEDVRPLSQVSSYKNGFDAADYASKSFNMFSGKAESVELKCDNSILEVMFDRFGEKCDTRVADENSFLIRTEAAVNEGLAGWIMQFGDKIEVKKPESLRELVAGTADKISGLYRK